MYRILEWLGGAALAIYVAVALSSNPRDFLETVAITGAVIMVHIVVHEFGHALVGAAMGLRVRFIIAGTGPPLFVIRPFGTSIELRLLPFAGKTGFAVRRPEELAHGARLRMFLATLAGPAATLALTIVGPRVLSDEWTFSSELGDGVATIPIGWVVFAIGIPTFLVNVLPVVPGNDGTTMAWLIQATDDEVAELGPILEAAEALETAAAGDDTKMLTDFPDGSGIDNVYIRQARAASLVSSQRYAEAIDELQDLLSGSLPKDIDQLARYHLAVALLEAEDERRWDAAAPWIRSLETALGPAHRLTLVPTALYALREDRLDDATVAAAGVIADARAQGDRLYEAFGLSLEARCRRRLDDHFGARAAIDQAHRLAPDNPSVQRDRIAIDADSLAFVRNAETGDPDLLAALRSASGRPIVDGARRAERDQR